MQRCGGAGPVGELDFNRRQRCAAGGDWIDVDQEGLLLARFDRAWKALRRKRGDPARTREDSGDFDGPLTGGVGDDEADGRRVLLRREAGRLQPELERSRRRPAPGAEVIVRCDLPKLAPRADHRGSLQAWLIWRRQTSSPATTGDPASGHSRPNAWLRIQASWLAAGIRSVSTCSASWGVSARTR